MPTNTTSPSRSSRAATAAIISSGVYAGLEAVVDSARESLLRLEPCRQVRLLLHVAGAVGHTVHELLEVARELIGIARDAFPADVKVVVAVVIALRVGGVRPPRLDHHAPHNHPRNHAAGGVAADDCFPHHLFH